MFCPRCGNSGPADQKYCRACGFELERVSLMLNEQTVTEDQRVSQDGVSQLKLQRFGGIAVITTVELALVTVWIALLRGIVSGHIPLWFGGVASLLLIGFSAGFTFLALSQLKSTTLELRQKSNRFLRSTREPQTSRLSEPPIPSSVTEQTTNLLNR